MFKAIVVDDEQMIRNGISSFINNSDTNFQVTATFADGAEAIDFLTENDVDLVITDIRMVNISGIELAKYIYENKPYIKVVILSGYADFEYARAAMKYNVNDYITKPTNFTDLKNTLSRIASSISSTKKTDINTFLNNIKELYADILSGNSEKAEQTLDLLFDSYTHGTEQLGQYAANIFEIIADRLYLNLKIQMNSDEYNYKNLPALNDYDDIRSLSSGLLKNAARQIPNREIPANDIVISKLLNFVEENFSKNISLQDAADTVFFNSSYCSRFFKEQTGENFSDYLLKVRMQHAVKLLKENKKIKEISEACGYRSSAYFTRIFKEYYNCTPSEYMRNL